MSYIFGTFRNTGQTAEESELRRLCLPSKRYGMAQEAVQMAGRLGMAVLPYYSHARSRLDARPFSDAYGDWICLDGRLDNYREIADELDIPATSTADAAIILAAFSRWGERCFERFIGDWAIALYSHRDEAIYLSRDHSGSRTLYFRTDEHGLAWSSHLDGLTEAQAGFELSQEYVHRYLACRPLQPWTPYDGILAVEPGYTSAFRRSAVQERSHWNSLRTAGIRFQSDEDYEENFLALFEQSVARRTGPGEPILAELSGGMDSSAIVCASDWLRRSENNESPLLDTVSYFDDSESSLNDRPYFSQVESVRGKTGFHIDTAFAKRTFELHDKNKGTYRIPGADSSSFEQERVFHDSVWSRGYRSILSGIGGDELTGGVPTPFPELADYAVSCNMGKLFRQALAWAIADRSTMPITLWQTGAFIAKVYGLRRAPRTVAPWLSSEFLQGIVESELHPLTLTGRWQYAPHELDNILSWQWIMETLPHQFPGLLCRPEYRYPFLDKDLVQFLWNIPREQLLRPGRRRSLMRRALRGVVPHDVLERRQKAFQLSAPLKKIAETETVLLHLFGDSSLASYGFIEPKTVKTWIQQTAKGDPTWWQALLKTISLELWVRGFESSKSNVAADWSLSTALDFGRTDAVTEIRRLQPNSG